MPQLGYETLGSGGSGGGTGSGRASVTLTLDPGIVSDAGEQLLSERTCNLRALLNGAANMRAFLGGVFASSNSLGVVKVRVGGTAGVATDGTVVATLSATGLTLTPAAVTGAAVATPAAGVQPIKLTGTPSAGGQNTSEDQVVLVFQEV